MYVVFLIIGFILLIKGADFFVTGSSDLAKRLHVPSVIIGLTIVALGTSMPEAAVSITASYKGDSAISVSNILGSNLFNLLAILGTCGLIKALLPDRKIVTRDFPVSIIVSLIMLVFILDSKLVLWEGIILTLLLVTYLYILISDATKERKASKSADSSLPQRNIFLSLFYIAAGLAGIIVGGELVVDNACTIAEKIGISDTLIGLTIVAIGTSLPELVTSVVALIKGDSGLAVGNIIGSNILNILFILGISSIVNTLTVSSVSIIDAITLCIASIVLFLILYKYKKMSKLTSFLSLSAYLIYMVYAIFR